MISSRHLLIGLLACLVITEPVVAMPINRFRSAYKTIRADLRYLFGHRKIDDPEQKKRIIIEIAGGIAIMLITGTVIWVWWIRPLKRQLQNQETHREDDDDGIGQNSPAVGTSSELQHIFRQGNEAFLNNLIDQSPDEDLAQIDENGNSILHYAASRNITKVVKKLLTRKLEPNKKNSIGETPLHFAAFSNQKGVVELLLTEDADPTIMNDKGETPSLVAEDPEIQSILGEAEKNGPKNRNETPQAMRPPRATPGVANK